MMGSKPASKSRDQLPKGKEKPQSGEGYLQKVLLMTSEGFI